MRRQWCMTFGGVWLAVAVASVVPRMSAQTPAAGVAAGVDLGAPRNHTTTAIPGVVAAGETVELLSAEVASGDGIIGLPDGSAAFIELREGKVVRISPDRQFSTIATAPGVKSIGADADGSIIVLLKDSFEIVYPAAKARVLASGADGLSLKTCNDFVVSRSGGIYATDVGQYNQPKYNQPTGIVYIPRGGKARRVAETQDTMALPNGIVLSPDEKLLFVVDSRNNSGMVWDVRADGSLANPRAHAKYVVPEAMDRNFTLLANGAATDADGRFYVAMPLGVQVFSNAGTYLGTIPTTLKIQSVSFAGPKKEYLYMLAQRAVWRVKTLSRGYMARAK